MCRLINNISKLRKRLNTGSPCYDIGIYPHFQHICCLRVLLYLLLNEHSRCVINGSVSGFHWYDANGGQTVETGLTITIGELKDGKYAVTIG